MNDENYINIQWWMINRLDLKWNELILYAIIYWFSQDWKNKYRWSLRYIQNALKISKNTVISTLNKLIEKWLIEKTDHKDWNLYSAKTGSSEIEPGAKTEPGVVQKLNQGGAEIEPNNNKYNYNNINNNISKDILEQSSEISIIEEIKEDKRDLSIDLIIETLKNCNMWIIDDTIIKQRRYWKLIKDKMNKIKWFNWDYAWFINYAYNNSDEYRKNHFRSAEKFYRELANIIAWLKIQAEKKPIRRGC